ncbi:hypothetical protein NESM_000487900 [Novymonas esmeraldas]|uniref:Uncharacterized protein n=1 Tax=Novymonas esmeraldas TaxID=1808958 RepID=A0AAW0EQ57_9TRYP
MRLWCRRTTAAATAATSVSRGRHVSAASPASPPLWQVAAVGHRGAAVAIAAQGRVRVQHRALHSSCRAFASLTTVSRAPTRSTQRSRRPPRGRRHAEGAAGSTPSSRGPLHRGAARRGGARSVELGADVSAPPASSDDCDAPQAREPTAREHDDAAPRAKGDATEQGWGLEAVDTLTGRTQLEALYESHADRIRAILEQPLPPMPRDGSVEPDFFVGFATYSYQLRDQYRAVLARELQVPVRAVRLSVAWSGRFDVRRFGRVQRVCGVCLDRQLLRRSERRDGGTDAGQDDHGVPAAEPHAVDDGHLAAASPLPEAMQQRIGALVAAINSRRREDLLQVQLFQASPPLPEVEFALTRKEHRLVYHLHTWLKRRVLRRAVLVVVYGVPPPPQQQQQPQSSASVASAHGAPSSPEPRGAGDTASTAVVDAYAHWQNLCRTRAAAQRREVEVRWLRLFHRRRLVPAVVSLTELATEMAAAVRRGDVLPRHGGPEAAETAAAATATATAAAARVASTSAERETVLCELLDEALSAVVERIAAAAAAAAVAPLAETAPLQCFADVLAPPPPDESTRTAAAAALLQPTSAAEQAAVLRWVRLVYQALVLHETHSSGDASAATTRVSHGVSLPALFAQGVYAGGEEEVSYLQHNSAAMDALLLHPHETSYKKKFVSRMRNGHRRPRMEEEESAASSSQRG